MKILQLTIHNIASVTDATIDFTQSPLASTDLFVITGTTGAGKTTLLDAICLALYRTTPRLQASGGTKVLTNADNLTADDPRNLMRRETGEAYVQLLFDGTDGRRYEAQWQVQRGDKKKVGQKLSNDTWTLVDCHSGQRLDAAKKEEYKQVAAAIEQAVGLDFAQFCRTTMLAQGEFTKFLSSEEKEKAAILEKITDTSIYTEIGKAIYRIDKEKQEAWNNEATRIGEIQLLTEEEIVKREKQIADSGAALERLQNEQAALQTQRQQLLGAKQQKQQLAAKRSELVCLHETYRQAVAGSLALRARLQNGWNKYKAQRVVYCQAKQRQQELDEQLRELNMPHLRQQKEDLQLRKAQKELLSSYLSTINTLSDSIRQLDTQLPLKKAELDKEQALLDQLTAQCDMWGKTMDRFSKQMRTLLSQHLGESDCICPVCRQQVTQLPPDSELSETYAKLLEQQLTQKEKVHNVRTGLLPAYNTLVAQRKAEQQQLEHQRKEMAQHFSQEAQEALQNEDTVTISEQITLLTGQISSGEQLEKARKELLLPDLNKIRNLFASLMMLRRTTESMRRVVEQKCTDWLKEEASTDKEDPQLHQTWTTLQRVPSLLDEITELESQYTEFPNLEQELQTTDSRINELEQQKTPVINRQHDLTKELEEDQKKRNEKANTAQLESLKADYMRWHSFAQYFMDRSSDGSYLRTIAQSFVLDSLLEAANRRLKEMEPRYRLLRVEDTLNLKLEDSYQGGSTRGTNSISGGEGFLVSLALALALAEFGATIGVNTLFIDEGFGTLSGVPLQKAINTLKQVHSTSGRQVGIISHREEVKENIPVRIVVDRPEGTSACTVTVSSAYSA